MVPMPAPRYAHAAATLDGVVHVVGGTLSNSTCSFETSHIAYDQGLGQWVQRAPMSVVRVHPAAAVLNDGVKDRLYVIGGSTGCGTRTATMEAYDPDSNSWTLKASMPAGARSTMGIAVIDNLLYVIGGQQADSGPNAGITAIVETYNPVTNTWATAPSLPGVRYSMASGVIDGKIYVTGGGNHLGPLDTTASFDPDTGLWSAVANLPIGHFGAASAVHNNRFYVIAGYMPGGPGSLVHVFDPVSNSWSNGPSLPAGRTEIEGAVVDGRIYAIGGSDATTLRAEVYVLDADTEAPVTTATPSLGPNGNGWNNSDVTITLQATDAGSGVQAITYAMSGAQSGGATVNGATTSLAITAEGTTTVTYHAVDLAGNVEGDHSVTVRIDKTAPLVGVPNNIVAPATTTAGAVIGFFISSSDPLSGVVSTQTQPRQSGATFPLGTTHESVTVLDAAGNATITGFDVTIVPGRPHVTINGGTFVGDGMAHGANTLATTLSGTPISGTFNIDYQPGGAAPIAPGRYSATASFISGDPAFTDVLAWTTKASDIRRGFASGGVINGRLYVVGVQPEGAASALPVRTSEFDPATNSWTAKRDATISRNQSGSAVIGSKLYIAGGCVYSDCGLMTNVLTAYDAATDTWSTLAPMPIARTNTAAAAIGDRLYLAGGGSPFAATNNLQIFDTLSGTWSTGAPLPVSVSQAVGAAINGRFHVIGGLDSAGAYRRIVQVYDPSTLTWSTAASMTTARVSFATAVANGRIYAVGGSHPSAGITGSIESYDPVSDTWTKESSLPTPRYALVAGVIDGVLYATSGGSASDSGSGVTEALDLSLTTRITIESPVVLESITVAPSTATLAPGTSQWFVATGHFSDGSSRELMTAGPGPNVNWESGNPSIASVNMFGLVFANAPGVVTVRASAGSVICEGSECATATVLDTRPPTLGLPNNMTVEAFSASGHSVNWFASAQDDVDGLRPVTCDPSSGSVFPFGTTTVNCSASDTSGNLGTGSFTVTVVDTNPPWLALPNNPTTREATNGSGAIVTYSATAQDSVDGPLVPSCAPASGSQFAFGETTVTCTVTDAHGNTGTGSFTVIVRDTTAPFLNIPSGTQNREATNSGGAIVTYTATANDSVDGAITPICTPSSGSQFAFGSTLVECSAMDSHGNTRTGSFTILVVDTNPPTLGLPNGTQTRQATSLAGAIVFYTASANDTADGPLLPSCHPASGAQFPFGQTTVNCSATDAHGNTRSGSFVVDVVDTTPPQISTPFSINQQATLPAGAVVTFTATAFDSVSGPRPVSCNPASGSTFPIATTTVTCTASDTRGNTASRSFPVTVTPGPPVVTITSPDTDAIVAGSVQVFAETSSAMPIATMTINGVPAFVRGTPAPGVVQWGAVLFVSPGTALNIFVTARDVQNRIGSASRVVDNDGIAAAVDTDPSAYSSTFSDGFTFGNIVRNGAVVTLAPRAGMTAASQITPGTVQIYACSGGPKYVTLNAPGEGADIACNSFTGTIFVRGYGSPGSTIEVSKQVNSFRYESYTRCVRSGFLGRNRYCYRVQYVVPYTYWYVATLAPGQAMSTGSPATADADNIGSIHVALLQVEEDSGVDIEVGSFDLDPGESADVDVIPGVERQDTVTLSSLAGTVTGELSGTPVIVAAGESASGAIDLLPPVLTVPANFTVNSNTAGGALVNFAVTAADAVDGPLPAVCQPASGSVMPVGVTIVSCSATDAQGNDATATFTVTVLSTAETVQSLLSDVEDFQQAQRLLENVLRSITSNNLEAACGQLGAFINIVNAQAGKNLTIAEAQLLVQTAMDARAALGCAG